MSALNNLETRLQFEGGARQVDRMIEGKLKSLKKALFSSYQSATIDINNKHFRCLINPDKNKPDYDNKILSIPYEDIQLNSERIGKTWEGITSTLIAPGTVFHWVEDNSDWIVYLQYHEERAYFRAEIRRCKKEVTINEKIYKVYYRGPVETTVPWNQKKGILWNTINYSAIIYITKNEETLDYFHRFQNIKIDNKPWEVKAVDDNSGDGIIEVQLKEDFTNELQEAYEEKQKQEQQKNSLEVNPYVHIKGDSIVYPYDVKTYSIFGLENGKWIIDNTKKAKIINSSDKEVTIEIITGKSGNFNLSYVTIDDEIKLAIIIKSL